MTNEEILQKMEEVTTDKIRRFLMMLKEKGYLANKEDLCYTSNNKRALIISTM